MPELPFNRFLTTVKQDIGCFTQRRITWCKAKLNYNKMPSIYKLFMLSLSRKWKTRVKPILFLKTAYIEDVKNYCRHLSVPEMCIILPIPFMKRPRHQLRATALKHSEVHTDLSCFSVLNGCKFPLPYHLMRSCKFLFCSTLPHGPSTSTQNKAALAFPFTHGI